MIKKAVILAGGKGTRLSTVVLDKPKPMADIAGLPFLHYMILDLKEKGIAEVVMLESWDLVWHLCVFSAADGDARIVPAARGYMELAD